MKDGMIDMIVAILAIGTPGLIAEAGANKQVTKDFIIRGTVFCEITSFDQITGWVGFNIVGADGVATHTGRYTLEGSGQLNLATGYGHDDGTFIAANGDKIFWRGDISPGSVPSTATLSVTSDPGNPGTGRFEVLEGGFIADLFDLEVDFDSMTMSFDLTGRGELTY